MEWKKQTGALQGVLVLGEAGGRGVQGGAFPASPSNSSVAMSPLPQQLFKRIVSQTKHCATLVGATFNQKDTAEALGGLQCPVCSHHSPERPRGWLCCQVAQARCPSQGGSVGLSLCQGTRGGCAGAGRWLQRGLSTGASSDCRRGRADVAFHGTAHSV